MGRRATRRCRISKAKRLYRQTFGVDVVHVPFQGMGPAVSSAVAGQTSMLGAPLPLVAPYIKDGTLRALAIASKERSADFPDVPTLAQAGIANQESDFAVGAVAPAKTPKAIVDLLHSEIVAILSLPDVSARLKTLGFEPVAGTRQEFATWIEAELVKWRAVARAASIRID
jgi:tripartite-type tricarboxylate transporter receptor subunit TctC